MFESKYYFKLKNLFLPVVFLLLVNAYLVYLLTKYVISNEISTILILIVNEISIFIGILFYLYLQLNVKLEYKLKEMTYYVKRLSKK